MKPASGNERYRDLVFHPFVRPHQGAILLKALGGGIGALWTHFFSSFDLLIKGNFIGFETNHVR